MEMMIPVLLVALAMGGLSRLIYGAMSKAKPSIKERWQAPTGYELPWIPTRPGSICFRENDFIDLSAVVKPKHSMMGKWVRDGIHIMLVEENSVEFYTLGERQLNLKFSLEVDDKNKTYETSSISGADAWHGVFEVIDDVLTRCYRHTKYGNRPKLIGENRATNEVWRRFNETPVQKKTFETPIKTEKEPVKDEPKKIHSMMGKWIKGSALMEITSDLMTFSHVGGSSRSLPYCSYRLAVNEEKKTYTIANTYNALDAFEGTFGVEGNELRRSYHHIQSPDSVVTEAWTRFSETKLEPVTPYRDVSGFKYPELILKKEGERTFLIENATKALEGVSFVKIPHDLDSSFDGISFNWKREREVWVPRQDAVRISHRTKIGDLLRPALMWGVLVLEETSHYSRGHNRPGGAYYTLKESPKSIIVEDREAHLNLNKKAASDLIRKAVAETEGVVSEDFFN